MPKLSIDLKKLNDTIIPSLETTITHLNIALDYINSSQVPDESTISLNTTKNDIKSVTNKIKELKNWCSDSVIAYQQLEEKYIEQAMLLPEDIIPLRKNRIKE